MPRELAIHCQTDRLDLSPDQARAWSGRVELRDTETILISIVGRAGPVRRGFGMLTLPADADRVLWLRLEVRGPRSQNPALDPRQLALIPEGDGPAPA